MTAQKFIIEANKHRICSLIGWTEAQYNEFQFSQGIKYLTDYCSGDDRIVNQFAQQTNFWNWYRNHWNNRDTDFLSEVSSLGNANFIKEYQSLHDMTGFRYKPHRVVMDMSIYDNVIYPATHVKEVSL